MYLMVGGSDLVVNMFPRLKRPLLINENLTKIRINGLISYLGNASVISRGASWGSNQQSLKTGNGKEVMHLIICLDRFRMWII